MDRPDSARWAAICVALVGASAWMTPQRAASPAPVEALQPAPHRLVIVGGGLSSDNEPVWRAVLDRREGSGPICVIPTASGVPQTSMESARETLRRYGGTGAAEGVMIPDGAIALANDPALAALLRSCGGYWFTGGQQSRVVNTFLPDGDTTEAYRAVRERFERGAVVSGSSAGAAMMSRWMIAGGSSAGAFTAGVASDGGGDGVVVREGMGFFTDGTLDQHFLARGRIGRLLVAVLGDDRFDFGLGIDENTALVVEGGRATVVGSSGVVVVDGRAARRDPDGGGSGLVLALAGPGDRIDLASRATSFASTKGPLTRASGPAAIDDPFARWAFLHALSAFARSAERDLSLTSEAGTMRLTKLDGFRAVASSQDGGADGAPDGLGAGPFGVSIARAR